ncbi:MAG: pyridoxine 5-phosphate synthase [Paracoccaceae bacterium]|jgi:pyridoxine 5-phosphate synthase
MTIFAASLGLEVHAGHGLTYDTVAPIAAFPQIAELNIGHFLIGEAIFSGLDSAIRRMRGAMDAARPAPAHKGAAHKGTAHGDTAGAP